VRVLILEGMRGTACRMDSAQSALDLKAEAPESMPLTVLPGASCKLLCVVKVLLVKFV
jgi:hypothetical protein